MFGMFLSFPEFEIQFKLLFFPGQLHFQGQLPEFIPKSVFELIFKSIFS